MKSNNNNQVKLRINLKLTINNWLNKLSSKNNPNNNLKKTV